MKSGRCCFSRLRARRRGISLRVNKANAMRKWDRNCGFARKMPLQNRTGGSNPSPSAIQSKLQRNPAALLQESLKIAAIPQVLPPNRTGERVPSNGAGKFSGVFLWRAHAQSGFSDFIGLMQYDHKPMILRKRLDFVSIWECRLSTNQHAVRPRKRRESPPRRRSGRRLHWLE